MKVIKGIKGMNDDEVMPPELKAFLENYDSNKPVDYSGVPDYLVRRMKLFRERNGIGELNITSSFWNAGHNLVENGDGFKVRSFNIFAKLVITTPEGREFTFSNDCCLAGEPTFFVTVMPVNYWDGTNELVSTEELAELICVLEDAAKAWEYIARFFLYDPGNIFPPEINLNPHA